MVQKFSKVMKDANPKIQEIHTISSGNKQTKNLFHRHVIVIPKKTKYKERLPSNK